MACCGNADPIVHTQMAASRPTVASEPAANTLARPVLGFTPPVYRFRDEQEPPNTFEDVSLDLLLARITQFRFENQLPDIAYLKQVVINFTMLSDAEYTPYIEHYVPDQVVHISAAQYIKGAIAFASARLVLTEAETFVDQAEAERRALICLNCPRNIEKINGTTAASPNMLQSKFAQLAAGRTTSVDGALKVCGVCTCLNRAKVHFQGEFIKESTTQQLMGQFKQEYVGLNGRPHRCWIADL